MPANKGGRQRRELLYCTTGSPSSSKRHPLRWSWTWRRTPACEEETATGGASSTAAEVCLVGKKHMEDKIRRITERGRTDQAVSESAVSTASSNPAARLEVALERAGASGKLYQVVALKRFGVGCCTSPSTSRFGAELSLERPEEFSFNATNEHRHGVHSPNR